MVCPGRGSKIANSVQLRLVQSKKNNHRIATSCSYRRSCHENCSLETVSEPGRVGGWNQGATVLHGHGFHSRLGNFFISFLHCWKYLATGLNSIWCKRQHFTRKKVQFSDRAATFDSNGTGLQLVFHPQAWIFLPAFFDLRGVTLSRTHGRAEWFSEGPTPSFRDTTVSRGLRITGVKSV